VTVDHDAATVRDTVAAVRLGDREAFGRLVELYQRRLFGLALMMTRDPAGAEDVAQDTFVRAFAHLDAYDVHRPFYPWISTIAVRLAQNWLVQRTRVRTREGQELMPDHDAVSDDVDPLVELIRDERDRALWNAVAALSSGERTAMLLYYRQEMSVQQIGSAMGVSAGTVKTLLFRGRHRLRRRLSEATTDKEPQR
jgi:RNA polymerase sigma-70 factor, ECF subfamily